MCVSFICMPNVELPSNIFGVMFIDLDIDDTIVVVVNVWFSISICYELSIMATFLLISKYLLLKSLERKKMKSKI